MSKLEYSVAKNKFEQSWKGMRDDPEVRIYFNNARIMLGDSKDNSWTIAVSVPIRKNVTVAKEILRGVAQAQEKAYDLWDKCQLSRSDECTDNLRPLRVLIASDDNDPTVAEKIAEHLVKERKDVIAVIGHNASKVSNKVFGTYQNNMIMISPTSYSFDHNKTKVPNNYVYVTSFPVEASLSKIVDYIFNEADKSESKRSILFCADPKAHPPERLKSTFDSENYKNKIELIEYISNSKCDFGLKMQDFLEDAKKKKNITDLFLSAHVKNILDSIVLARDNAHLAEKDKTKKLGMFSTLTLFTKDALLLGGTDIEGLVLAVNWHSRSCGNKLNTDFLEQAKEFWSSAGSTEFDIDIDITWRTAMAYDSVNVILNRLGEIPAAELNRDELQKQFSSLTKPGTSDIRGVTGLINFKKDGSREYNSEIHSAYLVEVVEGKFRPLPDEANREREKCLEESKIESN